MINEKQNITRQKLEKYLDDNNLSSLKDSIKIKYINEFSKSNSISTIRFFKTDFFLFPSVSKEIEFSLGVKVFNYVDSDINQIVIFDEKFNENRYFKYPEHVIDNPSLIHNKITLEYGLTNYVEKIFTNEKEKYIPLNSKIENSELDLLISKHLSKILYEQ